MARRSRASSGAKWGIIGGLIAGGASLIPLVPKLRRRLMQPTTILKKDHRKVSALIMTLEMTPRINGTVRRSLFEQVHHNVMVHAQAEEEVIYPALRNVMTGESESMISEAYREHQLVKDLLNDMWTMDSISEAFDTKLGQLKSQIQHHVNEEESRMFQIMTGRLSKGQLDDLGQRLHDRKKNLKGKIAA